MRLSAWSDPSGQTRGLARPPPGTRSELTQLHFLTFIGASGQEWKSQRTVLRALLGPCPYDTTVSLSSCCPAPRPTPNLAGNTHIHTHTHVAHPPAPRPPPALPCRVPGLLQPNRSQKISNYDSLLGLSLEVNPGKWLICEQMKQSSRKKGKKTYIAISKYLQFYIPSKPQFCLQYLHAPVVFWICVCYVLKPQLSSLPQLRKDPSLETLMPRQ